MAGIVRRKRGGRCSERRRHKAPFSAVSPFPQGGWRTKAADPLDLDDARPARAVSRTAPGTPAAPWTWVFSGDGAGRRGWPRSAAADRKAWFRAWSSVRGRPLHFAGLCYVSQRCSTSEADKIPPRFVPSFLRFHADLQGHRLRERHWHANWHDPELRSLVAQSSVPVSAMPRRVRPEPSSRRTRGVGTADSPRGPRGACP